jgi:uncharacterized protein YyaL (SSP411 family)
MERQSFENDAVAAMNEVRHIKVDREERPDVDQLYMTAVAPDAAWRLADERVADAGPAPFYGGTYFPPTDQYGRPGFITLLHAQDAYRNRRGEVEARQTDANVLHNVAEPGAVGP